MKSVRVSLWEAPPAWRQWLESRLSGVLPWPCLPVCLPVCFGPSACPSVALCHLSAAPSLCSAGPQTDTVYFLWRAGVIVDAEF